MKRMWDKANFEEAFDSELDEKFAAVAAEKGYYPVEDIDYSEVSDSINVLLLKCQKIENIVFVTIKATNNSGASIAAGTNLFKLDITIPLDTYLNGSINGSASMYVAKSTSYLATVSSIASGGIIMLAAMFQIE